MATGHAACAVGSSMAPAVSPPVSLTASVAGPKLALDAMPPEILRLILEWLVPNPPEIGETRPVAYEQLAVDEPWFEFTRRRRGLHSICLVSRRFDEMARPLLYRVISICNETSLVLFLRTLCLKPNYGRWTRYLSCHMTLTSESVIRETRRALTKHLPTFKLAIPSDRLAGTISQALSALRFGLQAYQLGPMPGLVDHHPQLVLLICLVFLTKLDTLLLQVPICDDHPEYDGLCAQVEAFSRLFSSFDEADIRPFQNIQTLLLQGDPELLEHFEGEDCDCEIPEAWGAQPRQYASLYESFPKLTTLEVSADDGIWTHQQEDNPDFLEGSTTPPPYLAGIRNIYLHNSLACPRNLHHVLLNAPQLETLYMTSRPYEPTTDTYPSDSHEDPEAFDVALTQHAKKLRNLDVSWVDVRGFECLLGADGRLASLAGMEQLETLCLQLAALYGKPSTVTETPLVELLPPNLVELALEDWWWQNADLLEILPHWDAEDKVKHYQSQHNYRTTALQILTQFARDVRTRMARLNKVVFSCKIPWTWVMEGAVPIDFHFERLKLEFKARGIDFSVNCDEV